MLLFQQVTYASSAINDATRIAIQMDTVKETDASEYDMEVSLLLSNVFCTTTQPCDILRPATQRTHSHKIQHVVCHHRFFTITEPSPSWFLLSSNDGGGTGAGNLCLLVKYTV